MKPRRASKKERIIQVRVDQQEHDAFEAAAKRDDRPLSTWVRRELRKLVGLTKEIVE